MTPDDHISLLSDRNLEAGRGDRVALVTDQGREVTFQQIHRDMCRVAAGLVDRGVRRGERVLLVLDDTPRFHAAFLGCVRVGAVPIPANFLVREEDFEFFLTDSYAVLAIVDAAFLDRVGPPAARLGVDVVVGGGTGDGPHVTLESWLGDGPDHLDPVTTHPEDPAFWLYSSGSTGRPKGVVHAHRHVAATCRNYAVGVLGLTAEDRVFSTTKLFHAYGFGNGLTFPLWVGASAVQMAGRPAPDRALEKIEQHRPTVLCSVPALYTAMHSHPEAAGRDLSSLRIGVSAAEALPAEVWRRWRDLTDTEVLDGIGSTEMLHIFCSNRAGEVVPGSSGRPVPGYELQLRGEDGAVLTEDAATGELFVAGGSALTHYWHRAEKTESTKFGRWVCSGDRYRRDADGVYTYEGRTDDMIKVKGLWVSPIEIENRLVEHPAVSEAAVIGVAREGLTRVKAHVILAGGHDPEEVPAAVLQDWCRAALQRHQYPHEVAYVEDFPRTATGKVQRFHLRDADRAAHPDG